MGLDADLIRAAQRGDRDAFGAIAASLGRPFLAAARRILHDLDLAEDATQETLVGIWHGLPGLREPARFEAWAYRILVRSCQSQAARVRTRSTLVTVLPIEPADPHDPVAAVIDREQLERAFRSLSIEQRTVIVLRYFFDQPLAQVGEVLGIPEGTAASRLHYAIETLRAALDADARPTYREAIR